MKTKLLGLVAFLSLLAALRLPAAAPVVLLTDNFTGTGSPDTQNLNFNVPARQSGSLGPVSWERNGNVQVGNGGEPHDGGNVLLCAFGGDGAILYNFNKARSAGGLKISFDLDPNSHHDGNLDHWGAVNFGSGFASRHPGVNGGSPHFGILFRANGGMQAFNGNALVANGPNWAAAGDYSGQLHHFDLVLTGPGDGNPFDASGDTKIDVYADNAGTPFYSTTITGGYTENFISFQASFIADFENVTITQLDPPAGSEDPWSYTRWTTDSTSGINPAYIYTHAYTFGGAAGSATINTVSFTAAPGGNPTVAGRFVTAGLDGVFGVDTVNGGPAVTGASSVLARSFVYNGFPTTLTVQGLTPGTKYVLSLFSTDWAGEQPGTRVINFSGAGGPRIIDQDAFGAVRNGIVISYAYTADSSGAATIQTSPLGGASFHVYGFANRETTLTPVPVSITSQPRGLCVAAGQNVTFNVGAVGEPAPTYRWLKNGTPIVPSETNPTFSLDTVTSANEGGYQVIVSNSVNSVTSVVAMLKVGLAMVNSSFEADTFGTYPGYVSGNGPITGWSSLGGHGINSSAGPFADNGAIPHGARVAFMQGDGALSQTVSGFTVGAQYYVVYFENARNGGIPAIEVQIGGTTIVSAHARAPVGGGNSYVEVTSDPFIASATDLALSFIKSNPLGGDTTALIDNVCVLTLAPNTPPSISRPPQGLTVSVGSDASFLVGAFGSLPFTYQWRKDGVNIADATSTTLALVNVPKSAEADYTVVVANSSGSVTSAVARLTVTEPIATLFNTGLDTTRTALADGLIDPHYTLLSNPDTGSPNAIVEDSTAFPIVGGPWLGNTVSSKWIGPRLNTAPSAVGFYTNRTTFNLTNRDPNTVFIIGRWSSDNSGRDILVNGVSTGNPQSPTFAGYTAFNISTSNATFLPGINTIDFVVENEASPGYTGLRVEFTASNARILPNVLPSITTQPASQPAVIEGNTVTFTVSATGSDPLTYQWSKDGTPLPGKTNVTLTLLNVTTNDNGSYVARASNNSGFADSDPGTLAVIYRRVPGIYSTGVNNDLFLAADSSIDLHWIVGSSVDPINTGPDAIVINQSSSPVPPWLGAGPKSKWIAPQANQNAGNAEGNYTYQTFFDLSGVDLCTFRLAGQIAVDNTLVDILVNGASQGISGGSFTAFLPFTITNGFVSGPNSVDFIINNAPTTPNPTALRVDLDGLVRIRNIVAPLLTITSSGPDALLIGWTPTGGCDRLQCTSDLTEPWTTIVGAPNPYTAYTTNAAAKFYRVLP